MAKKYDIVYPQPYTQNGDEKVKWINCGAVFEKDGKMSAKIDAIPTGFDGWLKFFEPKPRQDSPPAQAQPAPAAKDEQFTDDDIPF